MTHLLKKKIARAYLYDIARRWCDRRVFTEVECSWIPGGLLCSSCTARKVLGFPLEPTEAQLNQLQLLQKKDLRGREE